ncbi:cytochrome P450 [Cyathus striatus]|nr:cytochrome P450 [Cyathus striatus]
MFLLLTEAALLYIAWWFGSRYIRQYIFKGPLENIPGPPSPSFFTGNIRQIFNANAWNFHKEISEQYGGVVKIKAPFGESFLYVFDPKAMHHVVVKDQPTYVRMEDGVQVLFGDGILAVDGEHHKKQRKMLNPAFSTTHMREMIPIFWEVSHKLTQHQLHDTLVTKIKNGAQELDISIWMTRMALELVGQSGLGYSFDPMIEEASPHPYGIAVKELVPSTSRLSTLRGLYPVLSRIGTPGFRRWVINVSPFKLLHKLRDIIDFMHNTSVEILESKRKALEEGDETVARQVARGKDIMSILLKANMEASEEDRLPEHEVIAQISTLTFAAMDTTSNALSRILHLLSVHPEVQDKLRKEVSQAFAKHGDLGYDELESLSYLDAICRETLRLYPPVSLVFRTANRDIMLPLSSPLKGVNGKDIPEVYVPKGTNVYVSILAANRNREIWGEDVMEWNPERWLNPLPESVKEAHIPGIYSNLMTFIGGGRACIGFKFSQLEMKVVLVMLLKSFTFAPSDKEILWAMHGVAVPTVTGGNPNVPSLPIKMSLV